MAVRSEKIDIRLSEQAKNRLIEAAKADQRTLSEFVLTSALEQTDGILADRAVFELDAQTWERFQQALDAPASDHSRLRQLMHESSVFESDSDS